MDIKQLTDKELSDLMRDIEHELGSRQVLTEEEHSWLWTRQNFDAVWRALPNLTGVTQAKKLSTGDPDWHFNNNTHYINMGLSYRQLWGRVLWAYNSQIAPNVEAVVEPEVDLAAGQVSLDQLKADMKDTAGNVSFINRNGEKEAVPVEWFVDGQYDFDIVMWIDPNGNEREVIS